MEQHSFKDVTLRIFRDILTEPEFRDWPHVGIAIQAYLKDTEADLRQLLDWAKNVRKTPVWIRLVKGAYWDYETVIAAQNHWPVPVFTKKWQSDANFEKLTEFLLSNVDWLVPAFGSHNIRRHFARDGRGGRVKGAAAALRIPDALRHGGRALRKRFNRSIIACEFTPYGQLLPGMAYLVRRLLENSSNDSFLRQGFAGRSFRRGAT